MIWCGVLHSGVIQITVIVPIKYAVPGADFKKYFNFGLSFPSRPMKKFISGDSIECYVSLFFKKKSSIKNMKFTLDFL